MKIENGVSEILIVCITVFLMLVLLPSCNHKKESQSNPSISTTELIAVDKIMEPVDSFIIQKMEASGIVGLGAAIIVDKELVWSKGFGYADKENKIPFTPHTTMCIASISKTFTGVALMNAVEDGLVSLDEDINTYLPFKVVNPNFPQEKITLRNLATHTSSLADDYDVYDKTYHYGNDTSEELGSFLNNYFEPNGKYYSRKNFLDKKPGTYRDYSNIGAGLAGYIVELRTGKKLSNYGKMHIFEPLKMNDTGWTLSDVSIDNHSIQYEKVGDSLKIIPLYSLSTYPDGGVRSSVSDLSSFFIALLNEGAYRGTRILKKETAREMLKFQFTTSNKPENVNLKEPNKNSGIFWATKRDVTLMGHGGSDFGISTDMFCDLSKEVGVILFSNTSEARTRDIFDELWRHGELIKESRK